MGRGKGKSEGKGQGERKSEGKGKGKGKGKGRSEAAGHAEADVPANNQEWAAWAERYQPGERTAEEWIIWPEDSPQQITPLSNAALHLILDEMQSQNWLCTVEEAVKRLEIRQMAEKFLEKWDDQYPLLWLIGDPPTHQELYTPLPGPVMKMLKQLPLEIWGIIFEYGLLSGPSMNYCTEAKRRLIFETFW